MQAGKSVQFQSANNVVDAYLLRDVPAFSIYQQKQLMIKYEGSDINEGAQLLGQFLEMLQNSAAIYTLCVYEDFTGKINDKTPYHGSWNFRFNAETADYKSGSAALQGIKMELAEMRAEMQRQKLAEEMEQDEPEESSMDKIAGFLSHPLIERYMPAVLSALNIGPAQLQSSIAQNETAAAIAGIDNNQDFSKLNEAVTNMLQADPRAETALLQLGALAKNNPKKFAQILGYINLI